MNNLPTNSNAESKFIDEYFSALLNLEGTVTELYKLDPTITDYTIIEVYNYLAKYYRAVVQSSTLPQPMNYPHFTLLADPLQQICDLMMSKPFEPGAAPVLRGVGHKILTAQECSDIMKHLARSAKFWNKEQGRQGYLNYIKNFLP